MQPRVGDFCCHVVDELTGEAVPGVEVKLGDYTLMTDNSGTVGIDNLAPGDYEIKLSRPRYIDKTYNLHYIGKDAPIVVRMNSEELSGQILYSSNQPGNREIFSLDLMTRKVSQITFSEISETNPVFLTAKQIVFQAETAANKDELFIYNYSTMEQSVICSWAENDQHPSVNAKGTKMVFQSKRPDDHGEEKIQIFLQNIPGDDTSPTRIVVGENPVISPNGSLIAYVDGSNRLWIYDLNKVKDASNPYTLNLPGKINNPCWNPLSTKIAVELWNDNEPRHRIHITGLNNNSSSQVTFNYAGKDEHKHPCWSDDGDQIYFSANILYSSRMDIYCINVADESLELKEKNPWLMVSHGSGSKDYPSWGFDYLIIKS